MGKRVRVRVVEPDVYEAVEVIEVSELLGLLSEEEEILSLSSRLPYNSNYSNLLLLRSPSKYPPRLYATPPGANSTPGPPSTKYLGVSVNVTLTTRSSFLIRYLTLKNNPTLHPSP